MLAKAGLIAHANVDSDVDLTDFIFDKLAQDEPLALSPLTQRLHDEEAKAARAKGFHRMQLKDKLLWLHKTIHDPLGQAFAAIQYEQDPESGALVRKGELVPPPPDPFDIAAGIALFSDFYASPAK